MTEIYGKSPMIESNVIQFRRYLNSLPEDTVAEILAEFVVESMKFQDLRDAI